ncbi:MAG TPA: hypothetical protein PK636_05570, partial [bacterium]|nr:hypothetical protein [bacterium]
DPVIAALTPGELDAFAARHSSGYLEKYPGFRLDPSRPGRLIPQFYHLFPLWLAVFYRWAGLAGMFWLNPLAGLMALCAFFLALRRLWEWRTALAGTLLLSLNVAEIWQARFPTSEILSQFLFFAGLYCFAAFNKRSGRRTGLLAGVFFGCFFVSHISSALLLLPLALFYYGRWFLVFRPRDLWFLVPALAGLGFSLLPHVFFGFGYARLAAAQLAGSRILLVAAGILVLSLAAARFSGRGTRRALASLVSGKRCRLAVALVLVAAAIFGYCVRPGLGVENPERTNFLELGWFLTVPGLVLALAGMAGQVAADRSPSRWFLLLVLLVFGGLFLWQQLIHFCYMWAVRRYIVVVIPGGVAFAAAALTRGFSSRRLRGPASLVFVLTAVLTALASRPIWFHREYAGALGFARWLAGEIKADAPVLAGGGFVDKVPTYLDLALGRRVLPLYRDDRDGVAAGFRILTRGHSLPGGIYYLTDGAPPSGTGLNFTLRQTIPLHSVIWERCWDHLPARPDRESPDANFEVRVYRADNGTAPGGGAAQGGVQ